MSVNPFYLGGQIKTLPKDFIVEEVWDNQICKIGYSILDQLRNQVRIRLQKRKEYLHFTLVKQNWDTIRALKYIGRKIHVSLKRFGISGMKDKRAITAQRISLWRGQMETMVRLRFHDMLLKDFKYANGRINLGKARANRFTVTIREIPKTKEEIVKIFHQFKEVVTIDGVPNYYGPQRLSGGNVEVGEALIKGDLKLGTELILQKVQRYLKRGRIEDIPKVYWYERKMLYHLQKHPNDFAGALLKIPKRIRRLYPHAYQSDIFNNKLNQALSKKSVPNYITVQGFRVPKMPELNTILIQRLSYIIPKYFDILAVINNKMTIRFILNKGEYASTLLSHLLEKGLKSYV